MRHAMTNRQPSPNRTGFTLVELLVTIGVIAILAGILVVALGGAGVRSRQEATAALIKKLNGQVQERLEALDRFKKSRQFESEARLQISPSITDSVLREALYFKVIQIRYLPQSMAELWTVSERDFDRDFPGKTPSLPSAVDETESSEMLYYFLTKARAPGVPTVDPATFTTSEVADTDGDGLLEFVDAWGRPLRFYRWPSQLFCPSGTASSNPSIDRSTNAAWRPLIRGVPDRGTGVMDPLALDQDDPTLTISNGRSFAFEVAREQQPGTYARMQFNVFFEEQDRLFPSQHAYPLNFHSWQTRHDFLIVSAGPDSLKLGANDDSFGLHSPTDTSNYGHLARPKSGGFDALTDNITNRNRP